MDNLEGALRPEPGSLGAALVAEATDGIPSLEVVVFGLSEPLVPSVVADAWLRTEPIGFLDFKAWSIFTSSLFSNSISFFSSTFYLSTFSFPVSSFSRPLAGANISLKASFSGAIGSFTVDLSSPFASLSALSLASLSFQPLSLLPATAVLTAA